MLDLNLVITIKICATVNDGRLIVLPVTLVLRVYWKEKSGEDSGHTYKKKH